MPTPVLAATVALGYTWAPLPKPGSSFLAGAHCQPQVATRSSSDNRLPKWPERQGCARAR